MAKRDRNDGAPRRVGPEDEDRQSQLDDEKCDKRGAGEGGLRDTGSDSGTPRR